jgi:hypothetical protein
MLAYLATKDQLLLDAPSIADKVKAGVKKKLGHFDVTILEYGLGS